MTSKSETQRKELERSGVRRIDSTRVSVLTYQYLYLKDLTI